MNITDATYVASYPGVEKCPDSPLPEYAFIGRSNVGKSSLINMLTGRKNLAKISSTPGKTRLINFFLINKKWHLVDLPGYGFAKVSKEQRERFDKMVKQYLTRRKNLMSVFILVDSRISPQAVDIDFINRTGRSNIPLCLVFTKTDQVSTKEVAKNVGDVLSRLKETWEELPQHFITSAVKKRGREELLDYIQETNKLL